jgi:hypothetical protein
MTSEKRKHDFSDSIAQSGLIDHYAKGWLNAVSEALQELDPLSINKIACKTALVCEKNWHDHMQEHGYDLTSHDLPSFVRALDIHVKEQGPEGYALLEDNQTVLVVFKPGKCVCPLVVSGYLKPSRQLCSCPNRVFELTLEKVTGKTVESECLSSVAAGEDSCTFKARIHGAEDQTARIGD